LNATGVQSIDFHLKFAINTAMEAAFEASGVRDTMWVLGNRFDSFTKLWPHNRRRKCNPKNVIHAINAALEALCHVQPHVLG
jgi:hypothetical protein